MDGVLKNENSLSWRLFYKHFKELVHRINAEYIVDNLFSQRVITAEEYREFLDTSRPRHQRSGKLLSLMPERCCLQTFLDAIDEVYPDLQHKLSTGYFVTLPKSPQRKQVDERNSAKLAVFAEKLKARVLDGYTKDHIKTFEGWVSKLNISLRKCTNISRKQMIADYCFVLLDTMCVIQRTHSENKNNLWKNKSFSCLKSLIADCSNPELAQIKYYARYAMALLYGDKIESAKDYIDEAIYKLGTYLPSRELGNCYFVRVNLNFKTFSKHPSKSLKMQIIRDAETGFSFFRDDEDIEMKIKWWNVYISKKLFCNLGIGLSLEDIPLLKDPLQDCGEDGVAQLLGEMKRHLHHLDKRRTMHYYKAEAKFHELHGEIDIAEGFLKEAFKIAKESDFKLECVNLYESVRSIHQANELKVNNNRVCNALPVNVNTESESDNNNIGFPIDMFDNNMSKDACDNNTVLRDSFGGSDVLGDLCSGNDVLEEAYENNILAFDHDNLLEKEHFSNNNNLENLCTLDEYSLNDMPSQLTDKFLADIETQSGFQ